MDRVLTLNTKLKNESSFIELYNRATLDYEFWSKDFNMHFGYYIPFATSFLKRDEMLNQMNDHLFELLGLSNNSLHVADLGCGVGGTMNYGLKKYPNLNITGCTLAAFQVEFGNKFLNSKRGVIKEKNYNNTKFQSNSFDGAMAVESFCHSGCSKESLKEAYRILKPNSKLVIADAFIKKPKSEINLLSKVVHQKLCKYWSLEELGNIQEVRTNMERLGFKNITIKNVWYRVAPSVLHVPFAICGFLLRNFFKGVSLKKESIDNMKGSFYALLSAFCMQDFGYYIISAEK